MWPFPCCKIVFFPHELARCQGSNFGKSVQPSQSKFLHWNNTQNTDCHILKRWLAVAWQIFAFDLGISQGWPLNSAVILTWNERMQKRGLRSLSRHHTLEFEKKRKNPSELQPTNTSQHRYDISFMRWSYNRSFHQPGFHWNNTGGGKWTAYRPTFWCVRSPKNHP